MATTLATSVLWAGCGDDSSTPTIDAAPPGADAAPTPPPPGPYDEVALGKDLRLEGLDGPAHVARDRYGIAHIHAQSLGDAAFAQGYIMAHDRLPQMDLLRRFGDGTLSELAGAESRGLVNTDLQMRMHRMRPIAEEAYAALQASGTPVDAEIVTLLERFAAGVNAYAKDASNIASHDPVTWGTLPVPFRPWEPVDSLVLGRFQAFSLSWTVPTEINLTELYQSARAVFDQAPAAGDPDFDPARDARRGASRDLLPIVPIGTTSPLDGASVAPGIRKTARKATQAAAGKPGVRAAAARAPVPAALLASARRALAPAMPMGPHAFTTPKASSNNWAVSPDHTAGKALLAGDQHLSMSNPSIFYPTHLVVPGKLDVQGITFPGIPGVVLGHNGRVAWAATVVGHDVNDLYQESVVPCAGGSGDCVRFQGGEVPIETWTEEIRIGSIFSGAIVETREVSFERVPHHGPIIPTIENGRIVPRTGDTALSVRYTGHEVTHELRAAYTLLHADDVSEAVAAFEHMGYGGQNWVFADVDGNIGWTTGANVPLRQADAYAWHPETNPDGAAPFFVLPGEGGFEWDGYVPRDRLPQAINPGQGYVATANSDPVGATFDGDPMNDGTVDGRPLYVGVMYAAGLRTDRIHQLIQERIAAGTPLTLDELATIQHDSQSTFGARMQAPLLAALAKLDAGDADRTADVTAWIAEQPAPVLERVREATGYLQGWTLATPPAVQGTPTEDEIRDSVATTLFNAWVHFFLSRSLGDEYEAMGWDIHDVNETLSARVILRLLAQPNSLASGLAGTGQPVLCDDMQTADVVESCDRIALEALALALAGLADAEVFGTEDMGQWRWGSLHTLTLEPLFPDSQGRTLVPPPNDAEEALRRGYPRAGDNFVVNRADSGYGSLDFKQQDGPAQRFLATPGEDGVMRARMALPGGVIFDRESPHYRDLMDEYHVQNRHFDLPYTTGEIVSAGEERWVLRAP